MGRGMTAIAVGVAVWATGTSIYLYTDLHPNWWRAAAVQPAPPSKSDRNAAVQEPEAHVAASSNRPNPMDRIYLMNAAKEDQALTRDPKGHAEWRAPDSSTICGVTPEGRYVIKSNKFGQTRYDEDIRSISLDFTLGWENLGCSDTAPVHQAELLRKEHEEAEYDRTHEINTECLIARLDAAKAGDTNAEKRWLGDPHYCQNGHYQRDQAANPAH